LTPPTSTTEALKRCAPVTLRVVPAGPKDGLMVLTMGRPVAMKNVVVLTPVPKGVMTVTEASLGVPAGDGTLTSSTQFDDTLIVLATAGRLAIETIVVPRRF